MPNIFHKVLKLNYILIVLFITINTVYTKTVKEDSSVDTYENKSYEENMNKTNSGESEEVITVTTEDVTETVDRIEAKVDDTIKLMKDQTIVANTPKYNSSETNLDQINVIAEEFSKEDNVTEDDEIGDYPYTVSIQKRGSHFVSGALLNKRWILTSASDLLNVRESIKLYNARLGSSDCKKGQKYPLMQLEIHPSFRKGYPHYDLAMVKLAFAVEFDDNIKPLTVSSRSGWSELLTSYWPRLVGNGVNLPITKKEQLNSKRLKVCNQQALPWDTCYKILREAKVFLSETSRCMNNYNTSDVIDKDCKPGAGAPVVTTDGLFGITSGWTFASNTTQITPNVFTVVATPDVKSWIENILLYR